MGGRPSLGLVSYVFFFFSKYVCIDPEDEGIILRNIGINVFIFLSTAFLKKKYLTFVIYIFF